MKIGDYIVWYYFDNIKRYLQILEINEKVGYYKILDLETSKVNNWSSYRLNHYSRLMTIEEKIEFL